MKDKIVAALKAKYPKLSDTRINAYADKLVAKITEEKDIDAKIDDLNDVIDFQSIIKSDERLAKLEAEKKAANKKKPEAEKAEGDADEPAAEDPSMPAWAKKLIESNQALSTEIANIKAKESQLSIKDKVAAQLKDIPGNYWENWNMPQTEEEVESFVTRVTTGYEGFTKDLADKGFSNMTKPKTAGGGAGAAEYEKDSPQVKSVLAKL